jgi:NodT family efflux transporter outer membrane factor (OMF) lipoprotein
VTTARAVIALAVAGACGSCSLAPYYQRPTTAAPAPAYKELDGWKIAAPSDHEPKGRWWAQYQNPTLDALESQAADANQSLKAAFARLQEARAQVRIARAAYFPSVVANASATRSQISGNSPNFVPGKPRTGNDFIVDAELSYEFDLFGRVRNTVSGARASEQASAGDVAALELSLQAELASDYFVLQELDAQQELLNRTVTDYAKALQLTNNLYKGGAAAVSDVQQATAQLESARTQAEDTRLRRAQTEHAIAVLVGRQASDFHLDPRPLDPGAVPPAIDPGLPSQLLERRPDVAAGERRVAAANAAIGVARAAYFPVFSLAGALGLESSTTTDWIQAPSRFWSVGPVGLLTLFDAGLRRAQTAAARASYDEQVANYRASVLTAFQDVEDNLAALRQLERESVSEAAAVSATQGALDQAIFRYQGGIVTYLEVVSAENAALAARLSAVDIQTRRITASILLVRALGGDWRATDGELRNAAASNSGSDD